MPSRANTMAALILSILSSTLIMVVFKLLDRFKLDTFTAIVINYFTASALGFSLSRRPPVPSEIVQQPWLWMAVLIGILFVVMFFVIARGTQLVGISITSVATKMSVILPMGLSIILFSEPLNTAKIMGIALAFPSVILASLRKERVRFRSALFFLPIVLFLGTGIIDSLVKYTQETYLKTEGGLYFSSTLFAFSALTGLLFSFFRKPVRISGKLLLGGILLGLVNFGSLYFIVEALNSEVLGSSVIFGINNIGIVSLSALTGFFLFREKLRYINWAGLLLSILTLLILFHT